MVLCFVLFVSFSLVVVIMVFKCLVKDCGSTVKMHVFPSDPAAFQLWTQAIGRNDLQLEKRQNYRVCDIHFSDNQKFPTDRNRTNLKVGAVPDRHLPCVEDVAPLNVPEASQSDLCSSSHLQDVQDPQNMQERPKKSQQASNKILDSLGYTSLTKQQLYRKLQQTKRPNNYSDVTSSLRYCAVFGCDNRTSSQHRFPNPEKHAEMFEKWVVLCANKEISAMAPKTVYNTKRVCHLHFENDDFGNNNLLRRGAYPKFGLFHQDTSAVFAVDHHYTLLEESQTIPTKKPTIGSESSATSLLNHNDYSEEMITLQTEVHQRLTYLIENGDTQGEQEEIIFEIKTEPVEQDICASPPKPPPPINTEVDSISTKRTDIHMPFLHPIFEHLRNATDATSLLPSSSWALSTAPDLISVAKLHLRNSDTFLERKLLISSKCVHFCVFDRYLNSKKLNDRVSSMRTLRDFRDLVRNFDDVRLCYGVRWIGASEKVVSSRSDLVVHSFLRVVRHKQCQYVVGDDLVRCLFCAQCV